MTVDAAASLVLFDVSLSLVFADIAPYKIVMINVLYLRLLKTTSHVTASCLYLSEHV